MQTTMSIDTWSIDKAKIQDINGLLSLEESSFDTDRLSKKQFRYFITQSNALIMVTKTKNVIIAAAIVLFRKNSKKARVYSLAVEKAYRQKGVAQHLYQQIENFLQNRHYQEVYLEVKKNNHSAIQFYLKNKFEIVFELKQFYEDGTHAYRMRKTLNQM